MNATGAVAKGAGKITVKNLDNLIDNPKALGNATPEQYYKYFQDEGYNPKPLNDGSLKGIPFGEGGGFKVNWGGDKLLQYHPAGTGHHGGDAYWKLSSGTTGTMRFDIYGNPLK